MTFLTPTIMAGKDWRALELSVARLMAHCGWKSVQDIARSGDKGADILAVKYNPKAEIDETYLVQVKAVSSGNYVGKDAIQQAIEAQSYYKSKIVIVATNGDFFKSAKDRALELQAHGFDVRLWNGTFLTGLISKAPLYAVKTRDLRPYQTRIVNKIIENHLSENSRSLFILATGLGKTIVASTATDKFISLGLKKVLVLCHSSDLAQQLQREFWSQITKEIPTRIFMDGEPPVPIEGVNFGLYQTFYNYLGGISSDAFDLVIVDEAHHALANAFTLSINHLKPRHLIGMTATPWRGDRGDIESIFGEPLDKISLVDGMKMGYLSTVDYRLMCDNINWDEIPRLAKRSLSIRDLNKNLFLPQRDEAVIDRLLATMKEIDNPKIAVFSPSIAHAEEFAQKLTVRGVSTANASTSDRIKRRSTIMDFSAGRLQAITAVDVLNEGIDVPDVNILVFLRATHSRRIFVQQLGRGLRLAPGKQKVIVLDFVTDIRRLAAVTIMDREYRQKTIDDKIERLWLEEDIVSFSNTKAQEFVKAWLDDVASLEEAEETEKLSFPEALS
jgi:superfamily II DNA or RNA helicase